MDRVEEIEAAIAQLPPDDVRRILDWLLARDQARWEEQMDSDAVSGKLDFLFAESETERENGTLIDWPPQQ
jgi:hypothetical protein